MPESSFVDMWRPRIPGGSAKPLHFERFLAIELAPMFYSDPSIRPGERDMIYSELGRGQYMIRMEKGEDILNTLRSFAETKRIRAAVFEGIGSVNKASLGHYDFVTRKYKFETFQEDLEILTLSGNISTMNRTPLPHAHVTLGRRDFSVIGGHLDEGSSANMVEIGLKQLPGQLVKAKDEQMGLNVLQLRKRL